jgi:hypothetical protein
MSGLPLSVIPAKAGISGGKRALDRLDIPAFAGMTAVVKKMKVAE